MGELSATDPASLCCEFKSSARRARDQHLLGNVANDVNVEVQDIGLLD